MSKTMKFVLAVTLIIGIASFTLGLLSARDEGLTVGGLGNILRSNLEELNISPVYSEYSDVHEVIYIDEGVTTSVVITNTFPDLTLTYDAEMAVELYGDVHSRLDQLVNWSQNGEVLYIDFASVFSTNPTSTGLQAVVSLPVELESLRVTSISGDVTVDEINSRSMDIETKSSNVDVSDSDIETLRISSQSGNVHVDAAWPADLYLRSESGNLIVESEEAEGSLATSSGNIYLNLTRQTGDIRLESMSGNVNVSHEGTDYEYSLSSSSGNVFISGTRQPPGEINGNYGDGGNLITVTTSSGSIDFEQDD